MLAWAPAVSTLIFTSPLSALMSLSSDPICFDAVVVSAVTLIFLSPILSMAFSASATLLITPDVSATILYLSSFAISTGLRRCYA